MSDFVVGESRAGDLGLSFVPAGTSGYGDLSQAAVPVQMKGATVTVASLDDVIRSKTAANRPKDLRTLPILRELLNKIRRRRGEA